MVAESPGVGDDGSAVPGSFKAEGHSATLHVCARSEEVGVQIGIVSNAPEGGDSLRVAEPFHCGLATFHSSP